MRRGDGFAESGETSSGGVGMPQSEGDENRKRCEHHGEEPERSAADGFRSAQIPEDAADDDGQFPRNGSVAGGELGRDLSEIQGEGDGVERHVEDTGGQREPGFLESPEAAESAANPDVVARLRREWRRRVRRP